MERVKKTWRYKAIRAPFHEISEHFHINEITSRLIVNRGAVTSEEIERYLNEDLEMLPDPHLLKDIDTGVDIIAEKIGHKKKIRIIGDYDVDGITATCILYRGLAMCGACVDYTIPHRIHDGYGINLRLIEEAARDAIDTIITCDNGISALSAVDKANELGLTVIVTDHHELPFDDERADRPGKALPEAAALIDPKREDCPYPEKTICGAVVAWHFVRLLYDRMGIGKKKAEDLLEMAALGTVCDVMPLKGENRIIVKEGLERLRKTENKGLKALMRILDLDQEKLDAQRLAFDIGPALNAAGRLASAELSLSLLLCDDYSRCLSIASEIKKLNEERKLLTRLGEEEAKDYLTRSGHDKDKVLVICLEDCHESICGIVAGKLCDFCNRPAIVVCKGKEELKGSGRSTENYDLYHALAKAGHLLEKFGGHRSAAGLSLKEENLEDLRSFLNQECMLTDEDLTEKVLVDMGLPFGILSEELIREFDLLEPCGQENDKPLFGQRNLSIDKLLILGEKKNLLKFFLKSETGDRITAICYNDVDLFLADIKDYCGSQALEDAMAGRDNPIRITIAYTPQINEWNGYKNIELVIRKYHIDSEDNKNDR